MLMYHPEVLSEGSHGMLDVLGVVVIKPMANLVVNFEETVGPNP